MWVEYAERWAATADGHWRLRDIAQLLGAVGPNERRAVARGLRRGGLEYDSAAMRWRRRLSRAPVDIVDPKKESRRAYQRAYYLAHGDKRNNARVKAPVDDVLAAIIASSSPPIDGRMSSVPARGWFNESTVIGKRCNAIIAYLRQIGAAGDSGAIPLREACAATGLPASFGADVFTEVRTVEAIVGHGKVAQFSVRLGVPFIALPAP